MENLLLLLVFILSYLLPAIFKKTDGAISKRFEKTHRNMVVVGVILGIFSLVFGLGWLIAFFVLCFAFYTMICAFTRTKNNSASSYVQRVLLVVAIFFIFMFLATAFNSIATFFLASVCLCYWWVQYLFAPKKIDM